MYGNSNRNSKPTFLERVADHAPQWENNPLGCLLMEVLWPVVLVAILFVTLAESTGAMVHQVKFVNPRSYRIWKGWRTGSRLGAGVAFTICCISSVMAGVGAAFFCAGMNVSDDQSGPGVLSAPVILGSFIVAGVSALITNRLRRVAASLETVKPLTSEVLSQLPLDETLLRGSAITSEPDQLLRSAGSSGAHDGGDSLLRSASSMCHEQSDKPIEVQVKR